MRTPEQIQADIISLNAQYRRQASKAAAYDRLQNEGGEGYSTYEDVSETHYSKLKALKAELLAAEWTKEVTTERRAAWNAMVKAASARGENWSGKDQVAAEQSIGFTLSDLRQAIKLHNL